MSVNRAVLVAVACVAILVLVATYVPFRRLQDIGGWVAVYFVVWWTMLFVVLPFGVRSQHETGDVPAGTDPGAPVAPGLARKAAITSVISAVVLVLVYLALPLLDAI